MAEPRIHFRACNLCEAICGLRIEVEGERIRSIRGDADDPFSKGFLCPKATALEDVHVDPDRQKLPLRRTGDGWTRVGWEEAYDEVARRIAEVQARHGPDSVAIYLGNPNVHSLGALTHGLPLIRALRTHHRYSATSVDQLPHHLAATTMFGHMLILPVPDIDRTRFFLALGANPLASNGSMMTAPGMPLRLKALKARGGRLVVVDPRRTETAELADTHLFIRPGTDALLLAALVRTVLEEKLERPGRLAELIEGLDQVRAAVAPFAAERVAAPTGISADRIRALARDFAGAESAVAYGRVGLSTQAYGGVAQWLIQVLNVVTGNLDRPGGALFTRPAVNPLGLAPRGGYARHRTRVRKLPSFGGEFPVAALAEEILTRGPGKDPCPGGAGRQPGALHAQRGAAGEGARHARLHGGRGPVPERDHPARACRAAAHDSARARALRRRLPPPRGAEHVQVVASALPARSGSEARLGDLPGAHPEAPVTRAGAPAPAAPRGGGPARHAPEAHRPRAPQRSVRDSALHNGSRCRSSRRTRTASTSARSNRRSPDG